MRTQIANLKKQDYDSKLKYRRTNLVCSKFFPSFACMCACCVILQSNER